MNKTFIECNSNAGVADVCVNNRRTENQPALYSIIVPVYNRPDEAAELLQSLARQEGGVPFETVIVEDGSAQPCDKAVEQYAGRLSITYRAKPNTGRSDSRNVGMKLARGNYFIFVDSDCMLPPDYFISLDKNIRENYCDCFGGPDAAHESFSDIQKAISYAMTSFLTTGGIRGGKVNMEKFVPRTFNMGFSRKVYETVGGFNKKIAYGEDIDMSTRIRKAGFSIGLYHSTFVYHKRRVNMKRFFRQVNIFGQTRINLYMKYSDSLKAVHALPALFVTGLLLVVCAGIFVTPLFFVLPATYTVLIFLDALRTAKSLNIAALSVIASFVQIIGYGSGFIKSFIQKIILRKGLEDFETVDENHK